MLRLKKLTALCTGTVLGVCGILSAWGQPNCAEAATVSAPEGFCLLYTSPSPRD